MPCTTENCCLPADQKICRKCHEVKSVNNFGKNAAFPDGLMAKCRECSKYDWLWKKYKLTRQAYLDILEAQGGECANPNCDETGPFAVDHDHSCCPGRTSCGECVRGLLCYGCNGALGLIRDIPERGIGLAMYLRKEAA